MTNWIYSMKDVLSLLQHDGYIRENIPNSGEFRCSCPSCGGGKKIDRSFCVDLDTETYHCFKCELKGRFSQNLYAELHNMDKISAKKEIMSRLGIDTRTAFPKIKRYISEPAASIIDANADIAVTTEIQVNLHGKAQKSHQALETRISLWHRKNPIVILGNIIGDNSFLDNA